MENDDFMNDTFIVFEEDSGTIRGVYSEITDAYDRATELGENGTHCTIEAYTMDQDVDYDDGEDTEEDLNEGD